MNTNQIPTAATSLETPSATQVSVVGLPYHRTALANPRHRWWRPLATVVVTVAAWLVLSNLFSFAVGYVVAGDPALAAALHTGGPLPNPNHAVGALHLFGQLALLLPAIALGVRVGERRSLGTLSSIAARLRLDHLRSSFAIAAAVLVVMVGLATVIGLATGSVPAPRFSATTVGMLAVALLLVPVQAAAEEYAFRALPQQVLGAWLKSPWWGILLPVPLFVAGHLYDLPGLVSVGVLALVAGILTWRTGGLEAAIALHVVNNVLGVGLAAFGAGDLAATSIPVVSSVLSVAGAVVYSVVILRRQ